MTLAASQSGSAMRLFHSPTTPYGRKAYVFAIETGLISEIEVIETTGTPINPGSLPVGLNPLGKIPTLEVDGQAIYDSRVICRYLDAKSAAGLYPAGDALWPVLTLEATADGILDAALLMVYETRLRPEGLTYDPWVTAQWQKISRALDHVEARMCPLLEGPLTAAHIATGCALGYLDFRLAPRSWRTDRPRLAAWEAGFAQRPAMLESRPKA